MSFSREHRPLLLMGVACVIVALVASGCGSRTPQRVAIKPGATSVQSIEVDDRMREFRVYRPEQLRNNAPLVIVIHGWGFTAEQIEGDYGWNDLAEEHGFVVAYPEGVGLSFNAAGDCCGPAADDDVDDVAFITAIVEQLSQVLLIAGERTYAAGFSNGGVLAYALACRTSLFAAIGVVAGTQVGACDGRPRPIPVMHVHGTADTIVRFDGGRAIVPDARAVSSVIADWRRVNECAAPDRSRRGPVATARARCEAGREVRLVTIDGEGHTWPGRAGSTAPWDATTELWRFFRSSPENAGG